MEQNRVLSLQGGYVEIADSEKLNNIGSQVTVEAWVKVMEFTGHHMPIVCKGDMCIPDLSGISFACLVRRDGAICLNAPPRGQNVNITYSPQGLIELDTWFHVAGVVNGKNRIMSLFFNGAEVARASFNGNLLNQSTLPLRIGWMHEDESLSDHPFVGQIGEVRIRNIAGAQDEIHFAGQIDEVRIWNTARAQAEIQAAMHKSLTGEEPGLIGYWDFDRGSPNTAIDSSPERCHGKLLGDACIVEAELPEQGAVAVPAVLSGRIMDEEGQPRWGCKLECGGEEILSRRHWIDTSGEYRVVIPHPRTDPYDLYASIGKLGDMRLDIPLHSGASLDIDLTLREAVKIQGKLLMLDDETPHTDVAIQAIQDGEVVDAAYSNDKGEYWFVNLKPGEYQVRCHVPGGYIYYGQDQGMSGRPVSLHVEMGKTISDVDFRFPPFKKGTWRVYDSSDGLASMYVHDIHQDRKGMLWFASGSYEWHTGSGVSRYDGKEFVTFTTEDGLVSNHVWIIHSAADGALWFGTWEGASRYDGKGFTNFTTEDGLVHNSVTDIDSAPDGAIWFGTRGGVSRYDGEKFTNFTTEDGLRHYNVWSIDSDADGNLWIAEYGGGLSRYDGSEFINYTHREGLASNWVQHVYHDAEGLTWFATYGVGVLGYDGTAWTILDTWDGLIYNKVLSIDPDSDGSLWFGTERGATNYRRNRTKPGIQIVSVTADKTYSDLSSVPAFSIGTRVTIQYNAIDFKTHPDRRQYRCRVYETSDSSLKSQVSSLKSSVQSSHKRYNLRLDT